MHDCEWREVVKNLIIKKRDTLEVERFMVSSNVSWSKPGPEWSEAGRVAPSVLIKVHVLEGLFCELELVLLSAELVKPLDGVRTEREDTKPLHKEAGPQGHGDAQGAHS